MNYIPREKPHLVTRTLPEVTLNVLRANCLRAEGNWGVTRLEVTNCQNIFPFKAFVVAFSRTLYRKYTMPVRISFHLFTTCNYTQEIQNDSERIQSSVSIPQFHV